MTPKQEEHQIKKRALIELSKTAKMIQLTDPDERNINSILIEEFYMDDNNQEFNTFHDWIKQGKKVKKGEKAFLVWGRKRKNTQDQPTAEPKSADEKEFSFYPMCYLFSNAQVENRNVKN
jgi:SET domain-containing protein